MKVPSNPAYGVGPDELALVGEVAALVDVEHLWESLDLALRRLREWTGADAAELFLADPHRREMFLVSHEGADVRAFAMRDRFPVGEGFPGIVLRSGAAVATTTLSDEGDFLRARVKALRYRSAIAVPVDQDGAVGACLLLAWKSGKGDVERALRVSRLAAKPIAAAIETALARIRLRELERRARRRATPRTMGASARRERAGHEPAFTLSVRGACERVVETGAGTGPGERCPAEGTGHVQVLGGRAGWPCACLRRGCATNARYCIPLGDEGHVWGVASVRVRGPAPVPLTRHLPLALWMAEDIARLQPDGDEVPRLSRPATPAHLVVHCLGGFSVAIMGQALGGTALNRAKAWELLAMLVAAGGRPRSGSKLAAALWPEATPSQASNRFHVTLSALRRAIEPPGREDWVCVKRTGSSYFLDPASPVEVDLWRLQDIVRELLVPFSGKAPSEAQSLVNEVVALYAGDPFEGQFAGAWVDGVVRWCRGALQQVGERWAGLQEVAGASFHLVAEKVPSSARAMPRSSPAKAIAHATRTT